LSAVIEISSSLHARVREFARGTSSERFDDLALEIARFQRDHSPAFARLVRVHASALDSVAAIPAVPVDAFRLTRVAVHPPEADRVRFVTSGTTSSERGTHPMRTLDTYVELALLLGRHALLGADTGPRVVVNLARVPDEPPSSSLSFMMRLFVEHFDGRSLDTSPFDPSAKQRWLLDEQGVDVRGLERAVDTARSRGEPLLVLTTAFALVELLDRLENRRLQAPPGSTLMVTGGFKGRTRELDKATLRETAAELFGIDAARVVGEYGMTELTSQLYEATLPEAARAGVPDRFVAPPWLRVNAVDPATLEPLPDGELGIARFVDLGNVDSAVAIQTQDLVRCYPDGVELFGRRPGAPPRGCSLAVEALLGWS
jgi:hypothetical protein